MSLAGRVLGIDEGLSLLIAWLLISFSLGLRYLLGGRLLLFAAVLFAAALGFLPHELSHRYMARRLGCFSRFVLDPMGLLLTIISAFLPIKIIVPGYVLISTHIYDPDERRHVEGLTAAAGPVANIVVAAASLSLLVILHPPLAVSVLLYVTLYLSSWLALFNLLPVPPLDGSKIIGWRPLFWLTLIAFSGLLFIAAMAM